MNAGLVEDAQDDQGEGKGQGTDHWKGGGNLRGESKSERDTFRGTFSYFLTAGSRITF